MNTFMQFLDAKEAVVLRNGKEVTLTMPEDFAETVALGGEDPVPPYYYWIPPVVDSVFASAKEAGLQKGDSIIAINGKGGITSWIEAVGEISKKENKSQKIQITYMRDTLVANVDVQVNEDSQIGIGSKTPVLEVQKDTYSFLQAIPAGAVLGVETLKGYVARSVLFFHPKVCRILADLPVLETCSLRCGTGIHFGR